MCHQSNFTTCRSPTPQTSINRSLPKAFEEKKDSEVQKLCKNQASKPSRTSTLKSKNTQSRIIQTIFLDPKVYRNQAQRSEKHQQTTNRWLYGSKPLKPRRTSTINFRRRRTHEEHEECEEQRISNKLTTKDSLQFRFNNLRSILQPNWSIFYVQVKITLPQIQSISLARRLNQRITLL